MPGVQSAWRAWRACQLGVQLKWELGPESFTTWPAIARVFTTAAARRARRCNCAAQAQPASLAALVGALGARAPGGARPAFADGQALAPPAVSHVRPAWAAPLAAAARDAAAAPADLAVPLDPRRASVARRPPVRV